MKNRKIDNILETFYSDSYIENNRFESRANKIEFITTTKYIDKYLKQGDRILEVGAGTGAYTIHYAKKGYQVDAVELVQSNLDVLKNRLTESMTVNAVKGNALDLSIYEDNTFDVTLVLGPLYHLFDDEEVEKAIKEAIRVTKVNGKMFFAFVLVDFTLIKWGFQKKNIYDNFGDDKMIATDYKPHNAEEYVFYLRYFDEVKKLLSTFDITNLHYVASDGIGTLIKDDLNDMTEEQFSMFVDYHLSICERTDLIGYSGHILGIFEK